MYTVWYIMLWVNDRIRNFNNLKKSPDFLQVNETNSPACTHNTEKFIISHHWNAATEDGS